jgi:transposase
MAGPITHDRSRRSKSSRGRRRPAQLVLQKPRGVLGPRVRAVGAERFAFVCVDPAKERSEWLMADFLGNVLIEPRTLRHTRGHLAAAIALVREAVQRHGLKDLIVTVERSGNYHRPAQRAFAQAGFETRIVHPFAVKQYRQAADPGNKTDHTDLAAQHRAAAAGFGLVEEPCDENARRLRLLVRHRRDLVEKASALCCQIKEHLHLTMPGYAGCFEDLWDSAPGLAVARATGTPQAVLERGRSGLAELLGTVRYRSTTLEKILAWAHQAAPPDPDAELHHRIWRTLDDDRLAKRREIQALERDIAASLVQTPYILLLALPGLNVVSTGDLAGEMGPIAHYPNSNAITGRSGLFPSRSQSDRTDHADGPILRCANRRLRAALMRIADNLVLNNPHFRGRAELERAAGRDERDVRVRAAKRFSRLAFAIVAGQQLFKHPACQAPHSVLGKLIDFHHAHETPPDLVLADLQATVAWLPRAAHAREADVLEQLLEKQHRSRRGPQPLAKLLPAVLARLRITGHPKSQSETTDRGPGTPD